MHTHNHQNRPHSRQVDAAQFEAPPVLPPPGPETDPVFATAEAKLFVPGDKAKLDSALQDLLAAITFSPDGTIDANRGVLQVSGDDMVLVNTTSNGRIVLQVNGFTFVTFNPDGSLRDTDGKAFLKALDNISAMTNDAGYVTSDYAPAEPADWAGTPPATVAEAIDRLAAAVSNNGANPV